MVLGNEKRLTGGMRIHDEDHVIRNNYIANTVVAMVIEGNADLRGGIVINTGIIDVANGEELDQSMKGKELNKQWTPKTSPSKTTLVDTEWGIVYGNQSHRKSIQQRRSGRYLRSGVDVAFKHNVVDNSQSPEFVSVRATHDFPLVGANSTQTKTYVGQVTDSELIESYRLNYQKWRLRTVSTLTMKVQICSKPAVVTAETAGPNYVLENTKK